MNTDLGKATCGIQLDAIHKPLPKVGGTTKCTIDDLSDEILLQIFSHITPPALLLSTLSNVCLRWKTLCSDFSLYRTLVFQAADPDTSMAVAMVRGAPWLKSLELLKRDHVDDILCHLGESCPLLEKLSITSCKGSLASSKASSVHLRQVMTCCTKLRSLSLAGTSFTDEAVYGEIGSKLTSLISINFGHVPVAKAALMGLANHCVGVEEIRLTTLDIEEEDIQILCEKYKETLRILELRFCPEFTNSSLELLTKCKKLENVYLRDIFGQMTANGLKFIGLMPNIKQIDFNLFPLISSQVWLELLRSPNMKNVNVLKMMDCNVNDDVLSAISVLPNIERLELGGRSCVFTDKGLLSISNIPKLVELLLAPYESVTTDGWKTFMLKLSTKCLVHMGLIQCTHLDDEAALLIMEHYHALKRLTLGTNSKLSEGMKTTIVERMRLRGCDCRINTDLLDDPNDVAPIA